MFLFWCLYLCIVLGGFSISLFSHFLRQILSNDLLFHFFFRNFSGIKDGHLVGYEKILVWFLCLYIFYLQLITILLQLLWCFTARLSGFSSVMNFLLTGSPANVFLESQLPLVVYSFSDSTLANILSPQSDACGTKFELKVEEVLFVGHPMLAYKRQDREFKVRDNQVMLLEVLPGIRKFSLH